MNIFLVRHGEALSNIGEYVNDQIDDKNILTPKGIEQALKAHQDLKGIKFDKVYISPLIRTRQTAKIIAPDNELIVEHQIIEIQTGMNGKLVKEFHTKVNNDPINNKLPGYESFQDVKARVKPFLESLEGDNILIVTHCDVIRAILSYYKQLSDEEIFQLNIPNCEIIEISK